MKEPFDTLGFFLPRGTFSSASIIKLKTRYFSPSKTMSTVAQKLIFNGGRGVDAAVLVCLS
jgi:hypothetical protein